MDYSLRNGEFSNVTGTQIGGISYSIEYDSVQARLRVGGDEHPIGGVYTRFEQPCRIIDTRISGGPLVNAMPRHFRVAGSTDFAAQGGSAAGCGIPLGEATAAIINFVAVNPSAAGNLRATARPNLVPATGSIINYQTLTPNLNVANGVIFPICHGVAEGCAAGDITVQANGGSTQLVADVLGYLSSVPRSKVRPYAVTRILQAETGIGISDTCHSVGSITVRAAVAGTVVVHGILVVQHDHSEGLTDTVTVSVNTTPTECQTELGEAGTEMVDENMPGGVYYPVISFWRSFQVEPGTHTFYINGVASGFIIRFLHSAGIDAVFYPD